MATPYTLRAAQLRDLYHSLTSSALTSDERLDVLLTLKCTVKVCLCVCVSVCVCVCVCVFWFGLVKLQREMRQVHKK